MTFCLHGVQVGAGFECTACVTTVNQETGRLAEVEQDWFFTFGWGQHHPLTGESLANGYVVIHGTANSTRAVMVDAFGNRWSNQYRTAEDAGVERFSLRLVEVPPADVAPLFEEQVDTHLQRLEAERTPSVALVEERTEDGMCAGMPLPVGDTVPRCGHFAAHHPHRIGESVAYRWPEERTGVSDVQAEVRNAVRQLRHGLDLLNPPSPGLVLHMRGLLDRIEQLVGGEQR